MCWCAQTANGGRRYRLLMGRLLHLQRPLGFVDILRVLHPERASLPRVLCSLTREPPRRLQVGELGGLLGQPASLRMRITFCSSHLQLLHKRPVLRLKICISRVKRLVLRFKIEIVRV